ncbi:hypothetical protein [Cetobacterium somerae]|uniref:hypothetical protein n=1 Tax=Cetobacterium somerae TaxID=188913 RepID=UPI00248E2BEE|nr:hypothetical protein [Cetobacterium somerae]
MNHNVLNKIHIINTNEYLDNNFWVCIFHNNPTKFFDNSINKEGKIKSLIEVGCTYSSGIFPTFLVSPDQRLLVLGEYNLENERQKYFPNYPSRCSSFYVFPNKSEMDKAISLYNWKPVVIANVFLNTNKPFKALKANMEIVSSIRSGNPNQIPLSDYWNCKLYDIIYPDGRKYSPILEVIIEGEVLLNEFFICNQ